MSSKNNAKQSLSHVVGRPIFQRGHALFERGAVHIATLVAERVLSHKLRLRASVIGNNGTYKTSLVFDTKRNAFSNFRCSCPYEYNCKHAAALGFVCMERQETASGLLRQKGESENAPTLREEMFSLIHPGRKIPSKKNISSRNAVPKIREAKIISKKKTVPEKIDARSHAETLFQKLASVGIDPAALPENVLQTLLEKIEVTPAPERKSRIADLSKKYRFVLTESYTVGLVLEEIRAGSRSSYHYDFFSSNDFGKDEAKRILRRFKKTLSEKDRTLLSFLAGSFNAQKNERFDWTTFFIFLSETKFPLFRWTMEKRKLNPLSVSIAPNTLPFRLRVDRHPFPLFDEEPPIMLFDASAFLKQQRHYEQIFIGNEIFGVLRDENILLYPVPYVVGRFFSQLMAFRRNFYEQSAPSAFPLPQDLWEQKDAQEHLDELADYCESPKFSLHRDDRARAKFLIDYNRSESVMEMRAVVSYAAQNIDVRVVHSFSPVSKNRMRVFRKYRPKPCEPDTFLVRADEHGITVSKIQTSLEKKFAVDIAKRKDLLGFNGHMKCIRKGEDAIFDFATQTLPNVRKLGYPIEFSRDKFDFSEETFRAELSVDANPENDWLAFDATFYLGDNAVTLEELQAFLKNKSRFSRINGKTIALKNRSELERLAMVLEHFRRSENRFEGRLYHAPELENIFTQSPHYTARFSEGLRAFLDEAKRGKPVLPVKKPKQIETTLRDYQKEGVDWFHFLRKYRFAGVLADDMGLGKTLQALTMIAMHSDPNKPSLVVCPKTLLYNWENEAKKFFPHLRTLVLDGTPKEREEKIRQVKQFDLAITSYSIVQRDGALYAQNGITFDYCFIDESQNIKNHRTKNARFIKEIDADYRIAITGTPLENSVSEIWSVFDFLMPGFLGTYAHFTRRFLSPIMKQNNTEALQDLRNKTKCFMLRRTKADVLKELPPKIEQEAFCRLESDQNILYQEILERVRGEIFSNIKKKGFAKSHIHILAGLTKLRQICDHPALLIKEKPHTAFSSAKLDLFLELVEEILSEKKKVLVFSQFTGMLDILDRELSARFRKPLYLSGKTKNRQSLVDTFNTDPNETIFLISLKAGGTGLNLVGAEHVILFDPWWNPSVENQAIDRAHRIGQTKTVQVHRLVTQGTIEEKILALQKRKQFLFDNLVGESKDLFKHLTWNDVRALFE